MRDVARITRAVMRDVPDSLNACQHLYQSPTWIDVAKAKTQHAKYRQTLESLGIAVDLLPATDAYPDCCFIEDTAVLIDDLAIICRTGAASRRGEVEAVRNYLAGHGYEIVEMPEPAQLDGGDVLQIASDLFVGMSHRTNRAGFEIVADAARRRGRNAFAIEVRGALHLKSVVTYLDQGTLIGSMANLGEGRSVLERFRMLPVGNEVDAANVSSVNGDVLVPSHCSQAIEMLHTERFDVIPVDISEFHKAEAGLTCLTILGIK